MISHDAFDQDSILEEEGGRMDSLYSSIYQDYPDSRPEDGESNYMIGHAVVEGVCAQFLVFEQ